MGSRRFDTVKSSQIHKVFPKQGDIAPYIQAENTRQGQNQQQKNIHQRSLFPGKVCKFKPKGKDILKHCNHCGKGGKHHEQEKPGIPQNVRPAYC